MKNITNSKWFLVVAGLVLGCGAAILAFAGNPSNMAICIACFVRDTAGALKLHNAEVVQYVRPEIVGLVLGSFIIAIATKEFKVTSGSSPVIRFILGFISVIGALVFLGCPLRMVLRMSAGDLNAWIALIGFALGIITGTFALKKGFSLGRTKEDNKTNGVVLPIILVAVLVIGLTTSLLASSQAGPGSIHAPVAVALIVAIIFGAIAQKSRMCFAGGIRDLFLTKSFDLLLVVVALFAVMFVYNIATGNFHLSMAGQPIAHQDALWNILSMYVVGFAAVLAGGCPLRQLILAGQGSLDSVVYVFGMFFGAAMAHNLGLASAGDAKNPETGEVVLGGASTNGKIAVIIAIVVLFVIAFVGNKLNNKNTEEAK